MSELTADEKWLYVLALDNRANLRMIEPGKWAASPGHVDGGTKRGFLEGLCGIGSTPQAAIGNLWYSLTVAERLVKDATGKDRTEWRWDNGRWALLSVAPV